MKKNTSWDKASDWYHVLVEGDGSYQKEIILPNLLRLMNIKNRDRILDLGCGTGFFSRAFADVATNVTGLDSSADMIAVAKKNDKKSTYVLGRADNLKNFTDKSFDKITIILALQNMENLATVLRECARVLTAKGELFLVVNHPCFRVPKQSSWEWNIEKSLQFRRVDKYLSESKVEIIMHPGKNPGAKTISFHRPLQTYFKLLGKSGLFVTRLEEWISHRQGPNGKTFVALEIARKEIPLFLFLEATKI